MHIIMPRFRARVGSRGPVGYQNIKQPGFCKRNHFFEGVGLRRGITLLASRGLATIEQRPQFLNDDAITLTYIALPCLPIAREVSTLPCL